MASKIDALQSADRKLELISRYMDIVRTDMRRGSVKRTTPWQGANSALPSVPNKLLTLAAGRTDPSSHQREVRTSSILKEIRQHFHWLGKKSRRKSSASQSSFSPAELLQSNCILTVLLHNYAHQYIESMMNLYINEAKERFEKSKMV